MHLRSCYRRSKTVQKLLAFGELLGKSHDFYRTSPPPDGSKKKNFDQKSALKVR